MMRVHSTIFVLLSRDTGVSILNSLYELDQFKSRKALDHGELQPESTRRSGHD